MINIDNSKEKKHEDLVALLTVVLLIGIIFLIPLFLYLIFNTTKPKQNNKIVSLEEKYNSIINREYTHGDIDEIEYYEKNASDDTKESYIITKIDGHYELEYTIDNKSGNLYSIDDSDMDNILYVIKKYNIPDWEEMNEGSSSNPNVALLFYFNKNAKTRTAFIVNPLINYPNGGYEVLDQLINDIKSLKKESNEIEGAIVYETVN